MSDERLTGLAVMYIHPEINIDPHTVVDRFALRPVNRTRAESEKKETLSPANVDLWSNVFYEHNRLPSKITI
jgi:hypothetical protein